MGKIKRSPISRFLLFAAFSALPLSSCDVPFKWNADIKKFVDDGRSILKLNGFIAENGGAKKTVIPSGEETVVSLDIVNPRAIELACGAGCVDESLFDSLLTVTVPDRNRITFAFTPALRAERKDLAFTVSLSSPEIDNTFPPEAIVIHCNTPPGSPESSLDAALDGSGRAFAAFRLPSSPTDDDLAQVRIAYAHAESPDQKETAVFAVNEACLCAQMTTAKGVDILGTNDPLNRYFGPAAVESGENYVFSVVLIDTEGLESETAEISSDATPYSVTYYGNGNDAGSAPVDARTYRHTKPVTVLDQGTLTRSGYTFAGWNTASDGTGTAYAPGTVFKMGPGDLKLYAQWVVHNAVVVTFTLDPAYEAIVFSASTVNVARGTPVTFTTSVSGAAGWRWYVDNTEQTGQTASTFIWDTTGKTPGQYIINAEAEYGGHPYTGSIRVTVTY